METNASSIGWGTWISGENTQCFLELSLIQQPFQLSGTFCSVNGLKSVQGLLKEKTVQVLSDNVTKVAFSEHMGETQKQLDSVARAIYILAIDLKLR